MTQIVLIDGAGNGKKAKVNSENRLLVDGIATGKFQHMAEQHSSAFIVNSGFVNITGTSSFNALLYIKNISQDKEVHIERIRVCGTGASSSWAQVELVKNPTTGTLISDANEATRYTNSSFSSTIEATDVVTQYVASAEGKTITDGTVFDNYTIHTPGHDTLLLDGAVILNAGNSLAIKLKNNVAGEFCTHIFYYTEEEGHEL